MRVAAAAVLLGLLIPAAGEAQDPVLGSFSFTSEGEPIEITSNRLDFQYKDRKAVFRGAVHVVQGDITLDCDVLTVNFLEADGEQELEQVTADGSVVIQQGARTATGERATFDENNRTLQLTGNAVLEEGSNRATGDTIVVYPDESRMEIRGENSRVKLELFPKESPSRKGTPAPAGTTGTPTATPEQSQRLETDGSRAGDASS